MVTFIGSVFFRFGVRVHQFIASSNHTSLSALFFYHRIPSAQADAVAALGVLLISLLHQYATNNEIALTTAVVLTGKRKSKSLRLIFPEIPDNILIGTALLICRNCWNYRNVCN